MNIINRIGKYKQSGREWYQRALNTIKFITVHHTADQSNGTNDEILNKESKAHAANGWVGLTYHFFITRDGSIYQINNFSDVTWHDAVNWDSIGIALHGYFHPTVDQKPTEAQLKSLRELLNELCTKHDEFPADQSSVLGHRERSATACPGDHLIGYVTDYRNKKGEVDWGKSSVVIPPPTVETPINDCSAIENRFNKIIESKDAAIKAIYLGLPNADKSILDVNQHLQIIAAYVLKTTTSNSSTEEELLLVKDKLQKIKDILI